MVKPAPYQTEIRLTHMDGATLLALCEVMVSHCVRIMRRAGIVLLYASGVVYRADREQAIWDHLAVLKRGHDDCASLAVWRAAELLVAGQGALLPGDPGEGLGPIEEAHCHLLHNSDSDGSTVYHVVVRYRIGETWYRDDPSVRLGMSGEMIDRAVLQRWAKLGIKARAKPKGAL